MRSRGEAEPSEERSGTISSRLLPPVSRSQQVADLLREDIITGRLKPGEQLKQDALCREFDLSPAPVREALRQLESEGLVQHQPNRGVFVADITEDDLLGLLLPVRLTIEQHAVLRAVERMSSGELLRLEQTVEAMRSCAERGDLARVNELDVRFHELTIEFSGSSQALQLWRSVQPRIRAQIYRLAVRHEHIRDIVAEHEQLLDAIRSGNRHVLATLLEDHVIASARTLLNVTDDEPSSRLAAPGTERPQPKRSATSPGKRGQRTQRRVTGGRSRPRASKT
jgi:DNA-binding GntR family transcriptional regulator